MTAPVYERWEINAVSVQIAQAEKPTVNILSVIDNLEYKKRLGAGLDYDVVTIKLECLNTLLATPENERDFRTMSYTFLEEINNLRNRYIQNFQNFLDERDQVILDEDLVPITEKTHQLVMDYFTSRLDDHLDLHRRNYTLEEGIDLANLAQHMQDSANVTMEAFESIHDLQAKRAMDYNVLSMQIQPAIQALREKLNQMRFEEPTNIFHACFLGHLPKVHQFSQNENISKMDQRGFSPLDYAAYQGDPKIVQFLLGKGARLQFARGKYTPLHWAAQRGHRKVVEILLFHNLSSREERTLRLNAKGEYGRTPLHLSTFQGQIQTTRYLLSQVGIEVNAKTEGDGQSVTPLHNAVSKANRLLTLALLGDNRVDPHARSHATRQFEQGESPFMMALLHYFKDDITVIQAFLDHPKFLKYDHQHIGQLIAFAEQADNHQIKQALLQHVHNLT